MSKLKQSKESKLPTLADLSDLGTDVDFNKYDVSALG
jgi:hypothetical protein